MTCYFLLLAAVNMFLSKEYVCLQLFFVCVSKLEIGNSFVKHFNTVGNFLEGTKLVFMLQCY